MAALRPLPLTSPSRMSVDPLIAFEGDDLEEVAADLLRRPVGGGESKTWQCGQILRDQHLLQFACASEFLLHSLCWRADILNGAVHRVNDCQQQQGVGDGLRRKYVSVDREERRADFFAERPVGIAAPCCTAMRITESRPTRAAVMATSHRARSSRLRTANATRTSG